MNNIIEMVVRRKTKEVDGKIFIQCNKCGEFKEATNEFFDKNHLGYLGLQGTCKICAREKQKEYVRNNRDKIRQYNKTRYKNNKGKRKVYTKKRYENNKEQFLLKCREYRKENKDNYKNYMKKYIDEHREELREKRIERDINKGYVSIHNKTNKLIRKLGIKPSICPICGEKKAIYSHHPNYNIWNEIVFCCQSCHQLIHSGVINCPEVIDVLTYNK